MTRPANPPRTPDLVEDAVARLYEAMAILDVLDEGDLLAELPANPAARRTHQRAVSLLAVLRRELSGLRRDLQAAGQVQEAIVRASARDGQ